MYSDLVADKIALFTTSQYTVINKQTMYNLCVRMYVLTGDFSVGVDVSLKEINLKLSGTKVNLNLS